MNKKTMGVTIEICPECGVEIVIKHYSSEYVRALEKSVKMFHETLSQLIDKNKISPAMYIDFGGGWKETIGNIRAEIPLKLSDLKEGE